MQVLQSDGHWTHNHLTPPAPTIKGLQLLVPCKAAAEVRGPAGAHIKARDAGRHPAHVTQHCVVTRVTLDGEGCLRRDGRKQQERTGVSVRLPCIRGGSSCLLHGAAAGHGRPSACVDSQRMIRQEDTTSIADGNSCICCRWRLTGGPAIAPSVPCRCCCLLLPPTACWPVPSPSWLVGMPPQSHCQALSQVVRTRPAGTTAESAGRCMSAAPAAAQVMGCCLDTSCCSSWCRVLASIGVKDSL